MMNQNETPVKMKGYFENELGSVRAKLATQPHPSIALDYQRMQVELEEYVTFLDQLIAELSKIQPT